MKVSRNITVGPMPMERYLAHDALSSSRLKLIADCPARILTPQKEGGHLNLGTLCHEAVLEPEAFAAVRAAPEVKLNTSQGKDAWAEWLLNLGREGKLSRELTSDDARKVKRTDLASVLLPSVRIVEPAHLVIAQGVAASLKAPRHSLIHDMYQADTARVEHVVIVEVTHTSIGALARPLRVKIRLDFWDDEQNRIIDVKTVNGSSNRCDRLSFARSCRAFQYPVQGALYCDVLEAIGYPRQTWYWHAIEMAAPYLQAIWAMREEDRVEGRRRYENALHAVASLKLADHESLPGYCPANLADIQPVHVYWKNESDDTTEATNKAETKREL